MKHIIALLPMKGNSERVPNKNMRLFNGRPLYHWVLDTLVKSKHISKVIINTDSDLIKNDVKANYDRSRVEVNNRNSSLIGDLVSMNKIIGQDLTSFSADLFIQTHSTNPLLETSSIDTAIELMMNKKTDDFDSIFSVTKLQTRLYNVDGQAYNHNPNELIRTQDLEPLYEENSNFYVFTKESFVASGNKRIGKNPKMFEVDKIEAVDIDEPQDFIIAESLHKLLR